MIIFLNCIKRILRSKAQLAIMLIVPLLPIIPIAFGASHNMGTIVLGVADEDRTRLTEDLTESLRTNCDVVMLDRKDIENQLLNYKIHYAIAIDKGFTEAIIKSGNVKITGYANKDADLSDIVRTFVNSFMDPVKAVASASGGNAETFDSGLGYFEKGTLAVVGDTVHIPDKNRAVAAWGMIVQFMLFSSVFAATILVTDKENKTFYRTLTAPVRIKSYVFQVILSLTAVTILQILVLLTVTAFVFGIYPGPSFISMLLLFLIFTPVCVSFGIFIGTYCRNVVQASVVGGGLVVLMCVMGGAWGTTPKAGLVRNLSRLMPVSWAMDCVHKLLDNGQLLSITANIAIILLFAVVFFLLGTWRKADIVR